MFDKFKRSAIACAVAIFLLLQSYNQSKALNDSYYDRIATIGDATCTTAIREYQLGHSDRNPEFEERKKSEEREQNVELEESVLSTQSDSEQNQQMEETHSVEVAVDEAYMSPNSDLYYVAPDVSNALVSAACWKVCARNNGEGQGNLCAMHVSKVLDDATNGLGYSTNTMVVSGIAKYLSQREDWDAVYTDINCFASMTPNWNDLSAINTAFDNVTQAGDVVCFVIATESGYDYTHVGICGGGNSLISHLTSSGWDSLQAGYYLTSAIGPSAGSKACTGMIVYRYVGNPTSVKIRVAKNYNRNMYLRDPQRYSLTGANYGIYLSKADAQSKKNAVGYCYINNDGDNVSENAHVGKNNNGATLLLDAANTNHASAFEKNGGIYIREVNAPTSGGWLVDETVYGPYVLSKTGTRANIGQAVDLDDNKSYAWPKTEQGFATGGLTAESPVYGCLQINKTTTTHGKGVAYEKDAAGNLITKKTGYDFAGITYNVYKVKDKSVTAIPTENSAYVATFTMQSDLLTDGTSTDNTHYDGVARGIVTNINSTYYKLAEKSKDGFTLNKIPFGTYMIVETSTTLGFALNQKPYYTTITATNAYEKKADGTFDYTKQKVHIVTGCDEAVEPELGSIRIRKEFATKEVAVGNPNYSLAGAVFGLYSSEADAVAGNSCLATLTVDENGVAQMDNMLCATYYVKEILASAGCLVNPKVYAVTVTKNHTAILPVDCLIWEDLVMYPADILLRKTSISGAPIEGAVYEMKYYATSCDINPVETGAVPIRTWRFQTDAKGEIHYSNDKKWFVEGDDIYIDPITKLAALPMGILTIREISAPKEYVIDSGVYVKKIIAGGDVSEAGVNATTVTEQLIRGDLDFYKLDEDGNAIANVKFSITDTNGESHIVWTDEKGYYSTSSAYIPHSKQTNEEISGTGIWFGTDPLDDNLGALPYGTYTIRELRCDANKGRYKNIQDFTVTITEHAKTYEIGKIVNEKLPTIHTIAKDEKTNQNLATYGETITIKDTIECNHLEVGHHYTLFGELHNQKTGTIIEQNGVPITATKSFDAVETHMLIEVSFTVTLDALLAGESIVCFEYLTDDAYPEEKVAQHADINCAEQTVHIPKIATSAYWKNKLISKDSLKKAIIVDQVSYHNLVPGLSYVMEATLVQKDTGKLLTEDGAKYVTRKAFTPESAEGQVKMELAYDVSGLEDKEIVVYEKLYLAQNVLAVHEDLTDKAQTVKVPKLELVKPAVGKPRPETQTTQEIEDDSDTTTTQQQPTVTAPRDTPKTGDDSMLQAVCMIMLSVGLIVTGMVVLRKKDIKDKK